MARSLNKVMLMGNLTRDPELRYTPSGSAVCSFGLATNRSWNTDSGEKHEETEFHKIVSWNKLAELCSQFLTKGRKVYVEGRLSTRNWTGQDGQQRSTTEIIISDMILLDSQRNAIAQPSEDRGEEASAGRPAPRKAAPKDETQPSHKASVGQEVEESMSDIKEEVQEDENIAPDDIPF